ncbi:hypothetical protein COO60DRAFT_1702793 [Scenedesmus sp. NREL 46B-D3]|nr:hypothetical protein COO60DRAFT_1702793 [Scenedesmus sp. NREL 46B-D3]
MATNILDLGSAQCRHPGSVQQVHHWQCCCYGHRWGPSAAAASEGAAAAAAAAGAAAVEEQQPEWEGFDPYLKRLLAMGGDAAAAQQKAVKRNVQDYQQELSEVEQRLHARARASQAALTQLLELLQARNAAAGEELARLRALAPDAALQQANEQLQGQVVELQQQLDAAQALQRSTHALLKQSEDQAFEAGENLKSIQNDLADKEYALQAAQRKLQRMEQQQQGDAAAAATAAAGGNGSSAGMPRLTSQPSGGGVGGDAGAGPSGGGGAAAAGEPGSAVEELQAQVRGLQELLEQRTSEREAEADALSKAQQELAEAKARVGDESWVLQQSSLYALAQRQLAEAAQQLEARQKQLAGLQHDKDELLRHFEAKQLKEEVEKVLRSKVQHLQQQVDELNAKQVDLLQQKQALQVLHQQELARYGHAKTTAELQSMVGALQKEVDTHAGHARKAAEASAAADAARQEAGSARAALSASQSHANALQARLAAKAADLSGLSGREEALKERVNDLQAFVDVLTTFTADARDLLEVRRSEASLKARVAELGARLKGDALQQQLTAVSASEAKLRHELEAAASEAAELQGQVAALQQQVSGLQGEVGKKQAESEAFAQEINEAYNAFEEQRQQNATLLGQLTERDGALAGAQQGRLKLEHQLAQMGEQLSAAGLALAAAGLAVTSLRGEVGQLLSLKEAAEQDLARLSTDLAAAREQLLAHSSAADRLRLDLKARDDEKAALEVLLAEEKESAAGRARKAESDAAALRRSAPSGSACRMRTSKVERLSKHANTSAAVQELEEEINALRRLLKCNVCHTRQKDVIITKCWHMFCKQCIAKNLEARHRKCPGCGHQFGQADVKQFFFT